MSCAGQLIGAPVCDVRPIAIPAELSGFQVINGPLLSEGIGSGSRHLADVSEIRGTLQHREHDDNARRHAGVIAFFDWCWGDDPQWLVVATEDLRLHSHDHGSYLPPGGQDWSIDTLTANVDIPHPLSTTSEGLDDSELGRLAAELRNLTRAQLAAIVSTVPAIWPTSDAELDAVCSYLHRRAPQVAARIDRLRETLRRP